ncbi:undecaprenyl-diphosphate phosphatase [Halovulum sp. GXIMD14793]
MSLFHLLLLALVQGITEFLPVSSSGHLILLPSITGAPDQGTALDVAVHVGTLAAVMLYFRADVARMLRGVPGLLRLDLSHPDTRLAFLLAVATVPVVIAGLAMKLTGLADTVRDPAVVGWATIVFGLLLFWADRKGPVEKTDADWCLTDAIKMGLWQAVALIPGTSRSGITITAARMLGYARHDAARLAMLMSIPTILASGVLLTGDVVAQANWALARDAAIAAAMAFVAALGALALMMRLLRSVSFTPYVIYRMVLGAAILWLVYP